jgi:hypothetical protein
MDTSGSLTPMQVTTSVTTAPNPLLQQCARDGEEGLGVDVDRNTERGGHRDGERLVLSRDGGDPLGRDEAVNDRDVMGR